MGTPVQQIECWRILTYGEVHETPRIKRHMGGLLWPGYKS